MSSHYITSRNLQKNKIKMYIIGARKHQMKILYYKKWRHKPQEKGMYPRGETKKTTTKMQQGGANLASLLAREKRGVGGDWSMTLSRPQPITVRRASVRWRRKISRRWGRRHSRRGEGSTDLLEAIGMNNLWNVSAGVQKFKFIAVKFGSQKVRTREFRG